MSGLLRRWYEKYFTNSEAIVLVLILVGGFVLVKTMGAVLAPIIASLVIAYLLLWSVEQLRVFKIPKNMALLGVYAAFISVFLGLVLIAVPMLWQQVALLLEELPKMIQHVQGELNQLSQRFPDFFSQANIDQILHETSQNMHGLTKRVLTVSLASIPTFITMLVYLILIPVLVFFFLKDRDMLVSWLTYWLPRDRALLVRVWKEVDMQLGNYIRGKVAQILIVGTANFLVFAIFGLKYAALLACLVGLSVIVPYVGAALVTVPVVLVALFQWGIDDTFIYLLLGYALIQALDANILVPYLFSSAVNIHPVAIVAAVLFFGDMWGFWGVFFAIPLATLVKAVLNAWPRDDDTNIQLS
ncbi:MAG: AI-2E family transporter [Pseudomonadota bacterium]